ncbi:MAG: lytic transglycosylase domain-containing protein [Phycisphaeraceae bacterium]
MVKGTWKRDGPAVFGYQPGWLWWAAALMVVALGGAFLARQVNRQLVNQRYIDQRIVHHAEQQGLDVDLVRAVVEAESGGDWRAESDAGARGLMQVTPIALKDVQLRDGVGPGDLFDPDYNLRVGTLYLSHLLDRFEGDVALALAAYHMGPTRVSRGLSKYPGLSSREMIDKHAGPQTRAYVEKVLSMIEAE